VQRLRLVVILATIFIGLPVLVFSDADASSAAGATSDNDVAGSICEVSNS
jgi:hypothetical protein